MRTGRTLTVFRSLLVGGGSCLVPGGVPPWSRGGSCLVLGGGSCLVPGGFLPGPGGVWSGGYLPGLGGSCLVPGGGSWGGGAWSGTPNPSSPVNRMTHTCKNITLAKTSFRPVIAGLARLLREFLDPLLM